MVRVHGSSTYQDEREGQILTGFRARNRDGPGELEVDIG